jgi:hypothetical protein
MQSNLQRACMQSNLQRACMQSNLQRTGMQSNRKRHIHTGMMVPVRPREYAETATVPRCHGATVPRCHGATVPRCHGATVPRSCRPCLNYFDILRLYVVYLMLVESIITTSTVVLRYHAIIMHSLLFTLIASTLGSRHGIFIKNMPTM